MNAGKTPTAAALVGLMFVVTAVAATPFSHAEVREVDLTKDAIYDNALLWIAENFRSAQDVIQLRDRGLGVIVANGYMQIPGALGTRLQIRTHIRVEAREGRFRIQFSNVAVVGGRFEQPLEQANRRMLEPRVVKKVQETADELQQYLSAAPAQEDW